MEDLLVYSEKSKFPSKGYDDDAGIDLYIYEDITFQPLETKELPIDTRILIPKNYFGYIVPRSSYRRLGLVALAIIDANYTGELRVVTTYVGKQPLTLKAGERPVQLILLPVHYARLTSVKSIEEFKVDGNMRGDCGLGSTGR